MAKNDHRIIEKGGPLAYTCTNWVYTTDKGRGYSHGGPTRPRGSVLRKPLITHGPYSLWLEYVIDNRKGTSHFWLMWYKDGLPQITGSGVFDRQGIKKIIQALVEALDLTCSDAPIQRA